MDNWKKYIWVVPIVGAIITFISLVLPAITSSSIKSEMMGPAPWDMDFWLIGRFKFGSLDGGVDELSDLFEGVFSLPIAIFIVSFIGVLIGAILAVGSGVLGIRGNFRKSIALFGGVLMVAFTLIFTIYVEADISIFSGKTIDVPGDQYYYKFNPSFGIIGPIIGGVFCIASFFMDRIPTKERIEPETPRQPRVTAQPQVIAQPQAQPTSGAKFCTHCGTEVPGDFCPGCGKPFQPLIAQ